jgi:hypothetical protein
MVRLLLFFCWLFLHPVHVTLTSIDFAPESGGYTVFVRMFFDDFLADSRLCGNTLDGEEFSRGSDASRTEIEKYLNKKLIIMSDDKLLAGKLKDMELSDNEISINLGYSWSKKPDSVIVRNLLLTDLYGDMSNMVIVKVDEYEEGVKLTSDVTEQTFKIK